MYIENVTYRHLRSKSSLFAVVFLLLTALATPAFAAGNGPEFDDVQYLRYNGKIYVSGWVDDPDDDVDDFEVTIDGDVHGTAQVDEDGYFSFEVAEPWSNGSVFVVIEVEDPAGNTDADGQWLMN